MEKRDIENKEHQSRISAFPTILIYRNGTFAEKLVGSMDAESLREKIGEYFM